MNMSLLHSLSMTTNTLSLFSISNSEIYVEIHFFFKVHKKPHVKYIFNFFFAIISFHVILKINLWNSFSWVRVDIFVICVSHIWIDLWVHFSNRINKFCFLAAEVIDFQFSTFFLVHVCFFICVKRSVLATQFTKVELLIFYVLIDWDVFLFAKSETDFMEVTLYVHIGWNTVKSVDIIAHIYFFINLSVCQYVKSWKVFNFHNILHCMRN